MRHLFLLFATLPACIYYEIGLLPGGGDAPTETGSSPADDPMVDDDLYLSVDRGEPGAEVLTTLESRRGRSFDGFRTLELERDVVLLDQVIRDDDVLLLLGVSASAAPGAVRITATTARHTVQLAVPFTIVGDPTTPTADTGSSSAPTADTGSTSKPTKGAP